MNPDDLLNEVANETLAPAPVLKKVEPAEIKPYLAVTALVQPEIRDKWTGMVRKDVGSKVTSVFQPSNAYRKWDNNSIVLQQQSSASENSSSTPTALSIPKLLQDIVRNACRRTGLDESKTSKILLLLSENNATAHVNDLYRQQLLSDLKEVIRRDPNFDPVRFPNLRNYLS